MTILETIIENRGGHYVHAVEVGNEYDLQSIAEAIIEEFQDSHTEAEIIDFLESLEVHHFPEELEDHDKEEEVHNFSFTDYIKGTL